MGRAAAPHVEQLHAAREHLPADFREISARLRIPKATVGPRLIRARRKPRELLAIPAASMSGFSA